MKKVLATLGGFALCAGAAAAGDIERSQQSVGILFEQGRYAEFSLGYVSPDVSGSRAGVPSGDMAGGFGVWALGYKQPLNDRFDIALIVDQPIGAEIGYPSAGPYLLAGTTAELKSSAVTALLRFKAENNVSVYGGVRIESVEGKARIDYALLPTAYSVDTDRDASVGYVVGVAWEKPEIAARVALTYNSAIDHSLEATETFPSRFGELTRVTEFDTTVPQSVNLEFQTGVAPDTLLFGSIRWVDWSEFLINPQYYAAIFPGLPLVAYDSDRITYTLGLGRRFNETWSGAVTLSYEPSTDDLTGNLGPNDGFRSIGIGATYTKGNIKVTGGIRYVELGGATTRGLGAQFADNEALAVGIRVGYTF